MSPKGDPREKKFTMLMSDDEHQMLMDLAEYEGLPASMWIRRIVRQLHEKLKLSETFLEKRRKQKR